MNGTWRGFTIIETMLVLAITGLVVAVVLVNIGTALRNEQYHTAVDQVHDYFQGQYSLTSAIQNDRSSTNTCSSGGVKLDDNGSGRATSNCFILGRVLRAEVYTDLSGAKHQRINSFPAIARRDVADPIQFPNEDQKPAKQVFADASIVIGDQVSSYDLAGESDVKLKTPTGDANTFALTMLIARSPISGRVHTYYTSNTQAVINVNSMVEADLKLCVDPAGIINMGISPMGILIEKGAANASAVRMLGSGECV